MTELLQTWSSDQTLPTLGAAPLAAAMRAEAPERAAEYACEDVALAQAGDQPAFERLYRERVGPVSRYLTAIIRNPHRAEDVTAQVFLLAWRDLPKLRNTDRFDAWLFRIAHNQAMTELSRSRATVALEDAPEVADEGRFGAPERELEHWADVDRVREAMATLPEMQRQVLVLRYFREMAPGEVASQLGKNEQSVWALTYRALQNLKRALQADD